MSIYYNYWCLQRQLLVLVWHRDSRPIYSYLEQAANLSHMKTSLSLMKYLIETRIAFIVRQSHVALMRPADKQNTSRNAS